MGMESVMNFFRPAAAQTPATELKQPEQAPNGQQTQAPNLGQDPVKDAKEANPLDGFSQVWEAPKPVEGAAPAFDPGNIFSLNQENMQKALASVDFAGSITADQLTAIQGGGDEAVKALSEMLNGTARQVMGAATQASAKMIETAMSAGSNAMEGKIANQVKQHQVASHLQELNPALNHPAAAPMIQALQSQLTQQFPKASPAEIGQKVQEYMNGFAQLASGKPGAAEAAAKSAEGTDWEQYYTGAPKS
jgi:hypothetical protein